MIGSLTGKIQHKSIDQVIVDVGGVGYLVAVSLQTLADLPGEGSDVVLLCHTHVREDALQLYGFLQDTERVAFELLKSVSGVGPKLAMTILSGMPVAQLASAVAEGNLRRLTSIPGVGKKTAERLVLELKERFATLARTAAGSVEGAADLPAAQHEPLVEALVGLGYKRPLAERVVSQVVQDGDVAGVPPEQLLRRSLAAIQEL
jgi:Holliday junction DNA helicase RuvA